MTLNEYKRLAKDGYDAGQTFCQLDGRKLEGVVTVAGFKFRIISCEGKLVAAIPTSAKAAERGCLYLTNSGKFEHGYACFASKLLNATHILALALERSSNMNELYIAIGGDTCRCAICGAVLTDDLSTARGIGPECYRKIYGKVADKVVTARIDRHRAQN